MISCSLGKTNFHVIMVWTCKFSCTQYTHFIYKFLSNCKLKLEWHDTTSKTIHTLWVSLSRTSGEITPLSVETVMAKSLPPGVVLGHFGPEIANLNVQAGHYSLQLILNLECGAQQVFLLSKICKNLLSRLFWTSVEQGLRFHFAVESRQRTPGVRIVPLNCLLDPWLAPS